MGLVDVPEFRKLQKLAGAVGKHLLVLGLLQQRAGIFRHAVEKQEPLARHLIRQAHQRGIHLFRRRPHKVGVQQVAQLRQRLGVHRQVQLHQLALDAVVRQHHHGDKAALADGDELEPLHGGDRPVIGHGVGGVAHKAGYHLPGLTDDLIHLLHLAGQGIVDLGRLLRRQSLALHQLVDVQPVALGGRHTSRGGVGLLQIAQLHQIRQLVADGGGADLAGHLFHDGLGAHRLGGVDVAFHHDLQYLLFAVCQFHSFLRLALLLFEC